MLLDLKLQDMGGKELVHHLTEIGHSVPFIIMTGQGDERVAVDMMKGGALDYLVKDVDFLQFVPEVVRRSLAQLEKDQRLDFAQERANLGLTLMEQAYSSILVTDTQLPDPEIVYVNPAFTTLTGVSAHEVVGQSLSALERRNGRWEQFRHTMKNGKGFTGEVTLRRADGQLRITDCHIAPVLNQAGQLKHWAILQRDITRSKQLEKEILEITEEEQRRIGRDLHDGLGQQLTALELFSVDLADELRVHAPKLVKPMKKMGEHLREAIRQTRAMANGLSPVSLHGDGLRSALRKLADSTCALAKVDCKFEGGASVEVQDLSTATHLYRIAQEAVNNALKHGRAKRIRISLANKDGEWELKVSDNGQGFARTTGKESGMGLSVMKHRADLIGASLCIESAPRKGTQITCAIRQTP
jgi:PAS domain S-box-containing protein